MPVLSARLVQGLFAVAVFVASSTLGAAPVGAQTTAAPGGTATISGTLVTQDTGLPIAGATIALYLGSNQVATTTTDANGQYAFANQPSGMYSIQIRAEGFVPTRVDGVLASSGQTTTVRTPVLRAQTSTQRGLREIASVQVSAQGNTLASSSTIQHDLSPVQLSAQGYVKAADALGQVPGVNLSGGPHTVGDDTFIDIRGMGLGEVRPLVDGHPVGPIGVFSPDYYNYANSPYFLLNNIQVTMGSGATGLYGVNVIGGTIDFQTLNPTKAPHGEFLQSWGTAGTYVTQAKTTGSIGKFGYAFGHVVTGTYADFAPGYVFQSARPNNSLNLQYGGACTASNDLTSCNATLNTYSVSGNYRVQNDLGKLVYNFSPYTSLAFTAYAGNQLSDSTGNGDNDNLPYDTRLAEIQAQPQTCPGGYTVITDSNPNACYTAQQYAAASSGPFGGGQDRNRGTSLQDYHARLTTKWGIQTLTADVFRNYYAYRKNSNTSAGLDATGTYYVGGGTYIDQYLTTGILLSDDIVGHNNDFGFGYFVEHQREYGNNFTAGPPPAFVPQGELGSGDYSFFIRDNYLPTSWLAVYLNAWLQYSNVTAKTTFDPRLSLVFRPTRNDIFRLTGGRADGVPAASIKSNGAISNIGNPSSLNPSCTFLNPVASGGNPSLLSETATDYEAAYGHRFWGDTALNITGYVSSETNALFSGIQPILQFGPQALTNPVLAATFPGYAQKISSVCGLNLNATTVLPYLGVTTVYNAAQGLYRGLEFSGRIRIVPQAYVDFNYDVQSSQNFGISDTILSNNPFLLNGAQIYGIPVHKGSLTADFNDLHGLEFQIQGFYIGNNNTLNRPAYTFYNAFITKSLARNTHLTISAQNLFNQNVQNYGYYGHNLFTPTNQFAPAATTSIQQAVTIGNATQLELLGLQPQVFSLTLGWNM
ncbi:MAG: TonB-dependent receptor [Candidatus Eremiobacteraeota bacterium]|nr:TonB-dependent receptor [Candidatus Eremiobacteraeota bacterium]